MTLSVDLFFSFRSPYSYLALPKTRQDGRRLRRDAEPAPGLSAGGAGARILQARQSAIRALRRAGFQPRRQIRKHPVPVSPSRPDRAGHDDAGCRREPALHPPPDPPRRRGPAGRPLAGIYRSDQPGAVGRHGQRLERGRSSRQRRSGRRLRSGRDGRGGCRRPRPLRTGDFGQRSRPTRLPATGGCRPSCSRTSRSSARTASTC